MTATPAAATSADGTLDVSGSPRTSVLAAGQGRAAQDGRHPRRLLAAVAIGLITARDRGDLPASPPTTHDRTFLNFMGATATPQGFLLPVLGILLVTSEWGQRTALTTFALEPHRGRGDRAPRSSPRSLFGCAASSWSPWRSPRWPRSWPAQPDAWENIGVDDFAKFALLQVSGILQGLAFGLMLPQLGRRDRRSTSCCRSRSSIVGQRCGRALQDAAPWIDLGTAQQPLFIGHEPDRRGVGAARHLLR